MLRKSAISLMVLWLMAFIRMAGAGNERLWVEADVNTRLVQLGEPFRLILTAGAKHGWVRLPGRALILPGCSLLHYQETDVSQHHEGYLARQGIYTLAAFTLAEVQIPSLQILVDFADGQTGTARTWPILVRLRSLHPEEGLSLIDPRPPEPMPALWPYVLAGFSLGLAGLAIIGLTRRKVKRPLPRTPAHVEALHRLEGLGQYRLKPEQPIEDYFIELSRIMRRYLSDRYRFPAMEFSRVAILRRLEEIGVEAKRREIINQVLQESDLVKFAREPVSITRLAQAQAMAREFVELTREKPKSEYS